MILKCDGACEEHTGEVKVVNVHNWGNFNYCESAIEEDTHRGLIVTVIESKQDNTETKE